MRRRHASIAGPLAAIFIGVVLLLLNAGADIPIGAIVSRGWPAIIIAVGMSHILRSVRDGDVYGRRLFSGALITTVGLLFLLQENAGIDFTLSWPVLLVVGGSLALFRGVPVGGQRS